MKVHEYYLLFGSLWKSQDDCGKLSDCHPRWFNSDSLNPLRVHSLKRVSTWLSSKYWALHIHRYQSRSQVSSLPDLDLSTSLVPHAPHAPALCQAVSVFGCQWWNTPQLLPAAWPMLRQIDRSWTWQGNERTESWVVFALNTLDARQHVHISSVTNALVACWCFKCFLALRLLNLWRTWKTYST